jgi:hypothetical protein
MIAVQNSRKRSHFDPASQYSEDFLRAQKNALLATVAQYIAKTQTKDETLVTLMEIEEQIPKLCSPYTIK